MKAERMSFLEAVDHLANRVGIAIDKDDKADRFYAGQVKRAGLYEKELWAHPELVDYLKRRGLSEETIREFHLGFCPPGTKNERKMSNRIIFPIASSSGNNVALAGRKLDDESEEEKYVNDANSAMFKKGETLYGLSMARGAIQKCNGVFVVEGYFDQILMWQYGVKNAVALMSTAMTDSHIKLIKRYTNNVVIVLDGDKAGEQAMLRHIEELRKNEMSVNIVPLPQGMDPADVANLYKEKLPEFLINNIQAADLYQVSAMLKTVTSEITKLQEGAIKKILPVLSAVTSSVRRDKLIQMASTSLAISSQAIEEEYQKYQGELERGEN
jgi:DNA primase